ncbi:MAG TPA: GNAT family N-acetyltransferase [Candidatus Obscuribacterales bacterium]
MVGHPVPLTKEHNVSQFECGKPPLTDWLKKHALQSQSSGHTKTMVITDESNAVVGYYSYSVISVEHEDTTPERVKKGLARYSIPVFLIARLAIDVHHQGKGLGGRLLRHALKRAALAAQKDVPLRAIVVDAIDEDAKAFYQRFDFQSWPVDGLRMWLMIKDLVATLKAVKSTKRKHGTPQGRLQ